MLKCIKGRCLQTHPIPMWSYAAFLLLLTISVAIFIAQHSTSSSRNVEITMGCSKTLLTVYLLYSIIFMMLSFRWRKNKTFVTFERHVHQHSNEYLLVSVYVFGCGNITKSIQELFSFAHCWETSSDLIFAIVHLIFVGLQIMFLQGFSEAHFKWNLWVHGSLYVVVASNASVWLFYLLEETNLFNDRDRDQRIHVHCIHSNKVAEALHHWKEYLLPFTLEYCIIVTGLIYNLASRMIHEQEEENIEVEEDAFSPQISVEEADSDSQPAVSRDGKSRSDEKVEVKVESDEKKRKQKRAEILTKMRYRVKGSQPGLTAGIAVAIVMITALVCVELDPSDRIFFYPFIVLVNVSLIVGFVTILKVSSSYKLQWYQFRIDDSLLMFTSFGVILWSALSAIAAGGNKDFSLKIRILAILFSIATALAGVVQTATIIYMQRILPEVKDADYDDEILENHRSTLVEMISTLNTPRPDRRLTANSFSVSSANEEDGKSIQNVPTERSTTFRSSTASDQGMELLPVPSARMNRTFSSTSNLTLQSMASHQNHPAVTLVDALTRAHLDRAPESKFNQACMFTLYINLGFWVMDSFFEIKNAGRFAFPMGKSFYGERIWMFIVSITYPLCIFFRFHSAGMIYEMWAKFNGCVQID